MLSGRLDSFEHPLKSSAKRHFNSPMLLGILLRVMHEFNSNSRSWERHPIDEEISTKLVQPLKIKTLSFGDLEKSGILIKSLEFARSITFKFTAAYTWREQMNKLVYWNFTQNINEKARELYMIIIPKLFKLTSAHVKFNKILRTKFWWQSFQRIFCPFQVSQLIRERLNALIKDYFDLIMPKRVEFE